ATPVDERVGKIVGVKRAIRTRANVKRFVGTEPRTGGVGGGGLLAVDKQRNLPAIEDAGQMSPSARAQSVVRPDRNGRLEIGEAAIVHGPIVSLDAELWCAGNFEAEPSNFDIGHDGAVGVAVG